MLLQALLLGILLQATLSSGSFPISFYQCPDPGTPENGRRSLVSRNIGYSVTFSCDSKYQILGQATLTCERGSPPRWSGVAPACVCQRLSTKGTRQSCQRESSRSPGTGCLTPPPQAGSNAVIETSNSYGALYRCRDKRLHVRSSGDRVVRCVSVRSSRQGRSHRGRSRSRISFQWEGTPLSCREKATCQDLGIIRNGGRQIPIPPKEGDSAYFFCQAGSQMIGVSKTVCTRSGMWADPWPRCVPKGCPLLPLPINGVVFHEPSGQRIAPGGRALYGCIPGLKLVGDSERRCQNDGSWTGVAPTCQPMSCSSPPAPMNGFVELTGNLPGSIATYRCQLGYNLVGNIGNEICRIARNLTEQMSMNPESSQVDRFVVGNITQTCQERNTRVCQNNETWSGDSPTCEPVDCGSPNNPENGLVTVSGTTFGSTATYTCNSSDYFVLGEPTRDCLDHGRWNCFAPTCAPICNVPENPVNGMVSIAQVIPIGLVATYTCSEGLFINGEPNRTCISARMWSGQPPTCGEGRGKRSLPHEIYL